MRIPEPISRPFIGRRRDNSRPNQLAPVNTKTAATGIAASGRLPQRRESQPVVLDNPGAPRPFIGRRRASSRPAGIAPAPTLNSDQDADLGQGLDSASALSQFTPQRELAPAAPAPEPLSNAATGTTGTTPSSENRSAPVAQGPAPQVATPQISTRAPVQRTQPSEAAPVQAGQQDPGITIIRGINRTVARRNENGRFVEEGLAPSEATQQLVGAATNGTDADRTRAQALSRLQSVNPSAAAPVIDRNAVEQRGAIDNRLLRIEQDNLNQRNAANIAGQNSRNAASIASTERRADADRSQRASDAAQSRRQNVVRLQQPVLNADGEQETDIDGQPLTREEAFTFDRDGQLLKAGRPSLAQFTRDVKRRFKDENVSDADIKASYDAKYRR